MSNLTGDIKVLVSVHEGDIKLTFRNENTGKSFRIYDEVKIIHGEESGVFELWRNIPAEKLAELIEGVSTPEEE